MRRRSGAEERIAPWQITDRLRDDPIVELASPRADFDGALAQFLIGLLQTAKEPRGSREWSALSDQPPAPEVLREAFEPLAPAFELLGDGPRFLQDLTLESGGGFEEHSVERLLIEAPGENTLRLGKDHFVKAGRIAALCSPCAAAALLTLQTNAPSGGQGHRTGLRGGGPLTTLVVHPESLWATLWLNVVEAGAFPRSSPGRNRPEDRFPWLAATRTSEGQTGRSTTPEDVHQLQMFWAMPRRIRLRPDAGSAPGGPCSLCGEASLPLVRRFITRNFGVNYAGPWVHPLTPHGRDKDGNPLPIHGNPGGLSYRHWLGLVRSDPENGVSPALVVTQFLAQQVRQKRGKYRLWAFGYDMDNMKARAWLDGTMPLLVVSPEHLEDYEREGARLVLAARRAQQALGFAVKQAVTDRPKDLQGDLGNVGLRFWQETEGPFFDRLRRLLEAIQVGESDPIAVRLEWHRLLVRTARRAFEDFTGRGYFEAADPRRIARAWNNLQKTLFGPKMAEALGVPRLDSRAFAPAGAPEPAAPENLTL